MTERGYQFDFSKGNPAMHAADVRTRKARTMIAVLRDAIGSDALCTAKLLNVGCSTGLIDRELARHVAQLTGIDIDREAIELAAARAPANARFQVGDAMELDFAPSSFDIVVCSQVYEHVPDPRRMMREIARVLRPGGLCYFAATNRFCVIEQHYRLPFLSIIPVSWAHRYLRLARRGRYYHERHLGIRGLRDLTGAFEVIDYTLKMLREPERFEFGYMMGTGVRRLAIRAFAHAAYPLFPGYVWLLRKPVHARVEDRVPACGVKGC
ncbi:class I SAM-dependent methyltransferase [Lysobacter humi (ex Lee et al. 2017)]